MSSWYETRIDRQIREAQERGEFDNLPGSGKPLKSRSDLYHDDWWIRDLAERENLSAALAPSLRLRREVQDLLETLATQSNEKSVREYIAKLNERIMEARRAPAEGPPVTVAIVEVEPTVTAWRDARAKKR